MQPEQLQVLLAEQFPGCEVRVSAVDNHFDVLVVGEVFAGLRPVKRQQLVYAVLGEYIADGSIHAVTPVDGSPLLFSDHPFSASVSTECVGR